VESYRDSEGNLFKEYYPSELRRDWLVWLLSWVWFPVGISYFIWFVCGGWIVVAAVMGVKALNSNVVGRDIVKRS
jgi:hypothetical protein